MEIMLNGKKIEVMCIETLKQEIEDIEVAIETLYLRIKKAITPQEANKIDFEIKSLKKMRLQKSDQLTFANRILDFAA